MKKMRNLSLLATGAAMLVFSGCLGSGAVRGPDTPRHNTTEAIRPDAPQGTEVPQLSGPATVKQPLHDGAIDTEQFRPRPGTVAPAEPVPVDGRLVITVEDAVFMALRNNRSLDVSLYRPLIAGTFEEQERARFDPAIFAEALLSREKTEHRDPAGGIADIRSEAERYRVGVGQRFPTGTDIDLSLSQSRNQASLSRERQAAGVEITLTQALLRGAGLETNLAAVRRAEMDTLLSLYEVQGFTKALVAEVETTYWQYVLAQERVAIYEESLSVARRQVEDIERRIDVGTVAETELAAAQAELAARRQGLLDAENRRDRVRLSLLRLMNPWSAEGWSLELEPADDPQGPAIPPDPLEDHLILSLDRRPELAEARLRVEQGRLDVIQTRNGLLPRLDLFVTLGKTGYADSFGRSFSRIDDSHYDTSAGLRFEWALNNRAAEASDTRARAGRAQARASLENLGQLVVQDVHLAYLEVERARSQIEATTVRRRFQEEVVRAEQVKFDVGRSTALAVALAQRDLLESRLDEINAVIDYRAARIALYRLDGSLLSRRGIEVAGTGHLSPRTILKPEEP